MSNEQIREIAEILPGLVIPALFLRTLITSASPASSMRLPDSLIFVYIAVNQRDF